MLVFLAQSLVFVAVPKTGTTAIEAALKPRADIVFSNRLRHMTTRRFQIKIGPFLRRAFDLRPERFAVMRDPEEQIRSWYRYRARQQAQQSDASTDGMSFDEFVHAVISGDPRRFAKIGSQFNMVTSGRGKLLVQHLFLYEKPVRLHTFLYDRFGEDIILKQANVSPPVAAPLSDATRARLREARSSEFDLYARLRDAGGYLQTPLD